MKKLSLYFTALFLYQFCFAQSPNQQDTISLLLDFSVIDLPYQSYATKTYDNFFAGYGSPSMKQSLQMTTNLYSSAHFGIKQAFRKIKDDFWRNAATYTAVGIFDIIALPAPLGSGWLHEEYHRNVLTIHNARSKNQMNQYPSLANEAIYVYGIKDEDLQNIHDNHRADWRRLQVAGKEAELNLIQTLQKNNFFYNQEQPHIALYWLLTFSTGSYVRSSAGADFNRIVNEMNIKDGSDIQKRDFTGPDYTAWSYALFRPDAVYSDRGLHPSGVGINRYIKPEDLTDEELKFIRKQGNLQWLNFLSPTLFVISKIKIKNSENGNHYANFALRSIINPYGNDITLDVFYQTPRYNFFFALHNYNNRHTYFPGLEAQMIDYFIFNDKLAISPRIMLWTQPQDFDFNTRKKQFGGLLGCKARYNAGRLSPYLEVEGKTKGWVMGNVFLGENIGINAGLNVIFR
ncbi:MAG: hypothetical protein ACK40K_01350 [Raineya sp.]